MPKVDSTGFADGLDIGYEGKKIVKTSSKFFSQNGHLLKTRFFKKSVWQENKEFEKVKYIRVKNP
jgi:hypothetical protein